MIELKDYEIFFNEMGITEEEDRNAVLWFVRELFAITLDSINNEEKAEEVWS